MKDKYKSRESIRCHDCGAREGQIHAYGCDMERCPFCQGQLIYCGCLFKYVSVPNMDIKDRHINEWVKILNKKGRWPFIRYPLICCFCGELWPDFFMTYTWDKYIQPDMQDKILCKDCFDYIVEVIDNGKS